jgi:hypothetical protein
LFFSFDAGLKPRSSTYSRCAGARWGSFSTLRRAKAPLFYLFPLRGRARWGSFSTLRRAKAPLFYLFPLRGSKVGLFQHAEEG